MSTLKMLAESWSANLHELEGVTVEYPFRATGYFCDLVDRPGDAIWKQMMPDRAELAGDGHGLVDPLAEEVLSPVPNLVHRYPNRVLWLVAHECAMYCRFCTRKRRWKTPQPLTDEHLEAGLRYIAAHEEIRDVLLSGGDPLMLPLERLDKILASLRAIAHVQVIRIGTRVPCVWPGRVTPELAALIGRHHPVYMNLHFNHPRELTPASAQACGNLADAGIPLGSQTVLLKDVNDNAEALGQLFQGLLAFRVRPYYLLQMDLTLSTGHFRTPVSTGLNILHSLRNRVSGLAMPQFVVDLPGGQGKIPLLPNYVREIHEDTVIFKDYTGKDCAYPLLSGESVSLARLLREIS